jgi:sphinganine-1-phosphate aldolase
MSSPEKTMSPDEVLSALNNLRRDDVRWRDGKAFSLTYLASPEASSLVEKAYAMFAGENALNTNAFPSLRTMQDEVLKFIGPLLGAPNDVAGFMTSGGTESLLMVVYGARQRARAIAGFGPDGVGSPRYNIVLPTSAHAALEKACRYFDVESRRVQVGADWRVDADAMARAIDDHTILVVCSAPQYPQGVVDPVETIARIAEERGIPCHVDACMGGMLLPFLAPKNMVWNFQAPGVTSISVDLHKYGYSAKGAGVIMYRTKELRNHQSFITDNWLGGFYGSSGVLGTKSGGPIAAAWALTKYFGVGGYEDLAHTARRATLEMQSYIAEIPELMVRAFPDTSLLCIGSVDEERVPIFGVADALATRGWYVDRQQPPSSLHLTINAIHAPLLKEFASDLQQCVAQVRELSSTRGATTSGPGTYGTVE